MKRAADAGIPSLAGKEQTKPETSTAQVDSVNPTVYVAFELGWTTWKLASTVGLGQKPLGLYDSSVGLTRGGTQKAAGASSP